MGEGRAPSTGESEELARLQKFFDLVAARDRAEGFAKWIFASTATVATLAAAVPFLQPIQFTNRGQLIFLLAIVSLGVSLACATLALSPTWTKASLQSPSDLRTGISRKFFRMRLYLTAATLTFGLAILLASAAPLASSDKKPVPQVKAEIALTYTYQPLKLSATAHATGLDAGSHARLAIVSFVHGSSNHLGSSGAVVNHGGDWTASLDSVAIPEKFDSLVVMVDAFANHALVPLRMQVDKKP